MPIGCDVPWTAFRWAEGRSAMIVPARVNGHEAWFQLDTGADASFVYGHATARALGLRKGREGGDRTGTSTTVRLGGEEDPDVAWFVLRGRGGPDLSGTIGSDQLEGDVLVVDLGRARFAVLRDDDPVLAGATLVPSALRRGKLFVPVEVAGRTLRDLFWDSGASAFDLRVDRSLWTELTGLSEPAPDGPVIVGMQWGHERRWLGAAVHDLAVAGVPVSDAVAYYQEDRPEDFATWPHPAAGLFGNRPLGDRIVVADFGSTPAFGFLTCDE